MRLAFALLVTSCLAGCQTARENERCRADLPCARGLSCCDGICVDLTRDTRHCGGCGVACGTQNATAACLFGVCRSSCTEGFGDCNGRVDDGCEVNLRSDVAHCGACGTACSLANATSACTEGRCTIANCAATFQNCDTSAATGCEVNTASDARHCGGCGQACELPGATSRCAASRCAVNACAPGRSDCDGMPENGCEVERATNPLHCGACNQPCATGEICSAGACRTLEVFVFGGFPTPSTPTPTNRVVRLVIGQRSFTELVPDGGAVPEARAHHVAAWDGAESRMLVFGGGTASLQPVDGMLWAFEVFDGGVAWQTLSTTGPAPTPLVGMASGWDTTRRRWFLFGGTDDGLTGTPSNQLRVLDVETLTWTTPTVSGATPPPRAFAASMIDPLTGRFVLHGGGADLVGPALEDTWIFDATTSTWTQVLQSGPGPRIGHLFFEGASPPVLFGGSPDLTATPLEVRADLWELDLMAGTWTQHAVVSGPVARRDARGAGLAGLRHLFFGSAQDATQTEVLFNDAWALSWPARTFQQVRSNAPVGAAGVRSGFSVVSREPR